MIWNKLGRICSHESFDIPWYRKNTMVPVPYLLPNGNLRIFMTMCDEENIGRVGFVDVDVHNPLDIIGYSEEPCLDIGAPGMFDDSGVLPSCLLENENGLELMYSAYQRKVQVPYTILSGLAVSTDGGSSFVRNSRVPLLEAMDQERFIRSAPFCLKEDDHYRLWYSSGNEWTHNGIKKVPSYEIRTMTSHSLHNWTGDGRTSIQLAHGEYGLTTPNVFRTSEGYGMFYSIRSFEEGYRLGYAESPDGLSWTRKDAEMQIGVSASGWDSEMICFGNVFTSKDKTYLFYCGNHYGMAGMGVAELMEK